MRKHNKAALSLISLTCLALFSLPQAAHAQETAVADSVVRLNTGTMVTLLTSMNGYLRNMAGMAGDIQNAILEAMDGAGDGAYDERLLSAITGMHPNYPPFDTYNTNFILSGGGYGEDNNTSPVSHSFNLLALSGGVQHIMTETDSALYNTEYFDITTYNNNALLQNALMGSSATGHSKLTATSNATTEGAILFTGAPPTFTTRMGTLRGTPIALDNNGAATSLLVNQVALAASIAKGLHWNADSKNTGVPDTMDNDPARAFKFRCDMGFNPTWNVDSLKDPESILVVDINRNCRGHGSTADNLHANHRKDRQLNSLLNPMQYVAPQDMAEPFWGDAAYYRFQKVDAENSSNYIDIIAAASFCMNVSLKAYPKVPAYSRETRLPVATDVMYRETIDSKIVSDCWQFFEERVAYPEGANGSFGTIHLQQASLCTEDYNKHIISEAQNTHCAQYGRSALQARRDLAYRAYSPSYIAYLNTLGVQTRELIMAQALGEVERFEQSLLMERQIMTDAMALPERDPIAKGKDSSSTTITVQGSAAP